MIRFILIIVAWTFATAAAITIDSAAGKIARAQIHPASCGAC
jgi:hypothetical protein